MWKGFLFREIHRRSVQVAVNQGEPSAKENTRFAVTPRASLPASQPGPGTEFSLPSPSFSPKTASPSMLTVTFLPTPTEPPEWPRPLQKVTRENGSHLTRPDPTSDSNWGAVIR